MENQATKKQLWTLFCLTKKDFRNTKLTKEEASKMISELLANKKVDYRTFANELENAIEVAYKAYQEAPVGPTTLIYDADLEGKMLVGGSKYVLEDFSGCGTVSLIIKDRKLYNIIPKLKMKKHRLELSKYYYGGKTLIIDNKFYDNGKIHRLKRFYDTIATFLINKGFSNCYVIERLD